MTPVTPLLVLVVIGVVIWLIVRRSRRRGEADAGLGAPRRVLYYGLAFAALLITANGLTLVLRYLVDAARRDTVIATSTQQLALGLALTLVAAPIWLLFWTLARRSLRRYPAEVRSATRKLYLYVVLAIAVSLSASGLTSLLNALFGGTEFRGAQVATPVVWGAFWAYHWWTAAHEPHPEETGRTIRRVYLYAASAAFVAMLLGGIGMLLQQVLASAYHAMFIDELVRERALWTNATRLATAVALIGGAGWYWHWHRSARADAGSVLRQVYVVMFCQLGGTGAMIAAAGIAAFWGLAWLFRAPDVFPAAEHFRSMPAVVAAAATGAVLAVYHRAVARSEASFSAGSLAAVRRVYRYVAAVAGLATLLTGVALLVVLFVSTLAPEGRGTLSGAGWWKNLAATALTLVLLGGGVGSWAWPGAQREALGAPGLRHGLTRRIATYLVLGVAVLAVVASLSTVLFLVLRDALEGQLTAGILREARWGLGALVGSSLGAGAAWTVVRGDQAALALSGAPAAERPRRKDVTLVASENAISTADRLEALLGQRVRVWQRIDPDTAAPAVTDEQIRDIAARVSAVPGDRVLVVMGPDDIAVIPFHEA
jgi:hypothetical protein